MRDKFLILLIFFAAVTPPLANAQKSASAVMNVSIRIIKATNVKAVSSNDLNVDRNGYVSGSLGTVSITNSGGNNVFVETPEILELSNEKGTKITLPVGVLKSDMDGNLQFQFESKRVGIDPAQKGTYTGTMTTKIEYL